MLVIPRLEAFRKVSAFLVPWTLGLHYLRQSLHKLDSFFSSDEVFGLRIGS
jgi:hypothetical protein